MQLLRSPSSGVPTRLLSAVAAATGPEELARLAAAQGPGGAGGGGWVIRLVDVAPGANVEHYLRAWEGERGLGQRGNMDWRVMVPWSGCAALTCTLRTWGKDLGCRQSRFTP